MKKHCLLLFILSFLSISVFGQMEIDGSILYGNEWIDHDKTYWKITVSEDNMYKLSVTELREAGLPVDITPLGRIQMHHFGNSYPIFRSTDEIGQDDDYIMWYGKKNRSELDKFIFSADINLFNPENSLINDESAYFISISENAIQEKIELVETNLTGNTLTPLEYYFHEEKQIYNSVFYKPVLNSALVQYSSMVGSEGFGSSLSSFVESTNTHIPTNINLPISDLVSSGPNPQLFLSLGGNKTGHKTNISVEDQLQETITNNTSSLDFTKTEHVTLELPSNLLSDESVNIEIQSSNSSIDKHRVGVVTLKYPRAYNISSTNTPMVIPPSSSLRYLELDGYSGSDDLYVLDINDEKLYKTQKTNDKHGLILPGSQTESTVFVFSENNINQVSSVTAKTYIDYSTVDHDYIILTHSNFYDDGSGNNYIQEYADFRSSDLGGSYNPIIVDIADIYDQFAYGVDRHFISIRNFNHFVKKEWPSIRFLFIIGNSLEYKLFRSEQQQSENPNLFYVPTFGTPGSDALLMAGQDSNSPIFGFGRLAAASSADVKGYLEKAIGFAESRKNPQTIEDKLWIKEILHLSGGAKQSEQDDIANRLRIMEDTIESGANLYGGNVLTFYKRSSAAVEIALSEQIFDRINEGTSIITFFGHAAVGTFDFNLDKVENYENQGKYPLLMSLGCYSGNIHTDDDISISKDFVLTPNKGAIAFLASSGSAYIPQQHNFATDLYELIGKEYYGKPLGEVIVNVLKKYDGSTSFRTNTFLQQMSLHGDPAIVLQGYEGADVISDQTSAKTTPSVVDTYQEEFDFCFDVVNLGAAVNDSLEINIQHIDPSGTIQHDTTITVKLPSYRDQVCTTIPLNSRLLLGENTVKVNLDPNNLVTEYPDGEAEANNSLIINNEEGYKFFILSNSAVPTFPKEYGIVNERQVKLIASTYNAFDTPQMFHIQIDTTELFDSPALQKFDISNAQGTFSQMVDLLPTAETVYYWRVSQDSTMSENGAVWNTSSFVYAPEDGNGWNHSHYYQFLDDDLQNIEYSDRKLKYVNNVKDIRFALNHPVYLYSFYINEAQWDQWNLNVTKGVAVVVFDPVVGDAWLRFPEDETIYGSELTNRRTHYFNFIGDTKDSRDALANFLANDIPDGHSVVLNFRGNYKIDDWYDEINEPGSFFNILEQEGAQDLQELSELGANPYLLGFVKGEDERVIVEEIDVDPTEGEGINSSFQVTVLWDNGSLLSPKIGPSNGYNKLEWAVESTNFSDNDTIGIDIIGVTTLGNETTIQENVTEFNFDMSSIDHNEYPYIRLRWNTKDNKDFTTTQIKKLRVLYNGFPDIATDLTAQFKSEYEEGESLNIEINLENISSVDMGQFGAKYKVTNKNNESTVIEHEIPAIPAGQSYADNLILETASLDGDHTIEFIANESKSPIEEYFHNNFALSSFNVKPDNIAPVMEVTFDGIQILDEDIVSANPLINISVQDDNPNLLIDDTSSFTMLLEYPDGNVKQVNMDDPDVVFAPATSGTKNSASLDFSPKLIQDGTYTLTVNARDASQNTAGNSSYTIRFRVFNEEMVSNVFNYPNPFSTSTQFVFTLTGDEDPGNLLIRIMTVTGKVVKEITMAELGNVRIGINKTDYKWDGTDEYGDRLANGVYLYQVITKKLDGSDYIKFQDPTQNNTDYLFKEGFGKMVIMR